MDEIDAIGGRRFSEGTSADRYKMRKSSCLIVRFLSGEVFFNFITLSREIQRTLMELLNQLDGFEVLSKVKIIMATNRYMPFLRS